MAEGLAAIASYMGIGDVVKFKFKGGAALGLASFAVNSATTAFGGNAKTAVWGSVSPHHNSG